MVYRILKAIPDLMYIKHTGKGLYSVCYNYRWTYISNTINFSKKDDEWPRTFSTLNTYRAAKRTLNEFMSKLDSDLDRGFQIKIEK